MATKIKSTGGGLKARPETQMQPSVQNGTTVNAAGYSHSSGNTVGEVLPATYENILNSPIGTKLRNSKTGEVWENTQQAKDWIKQKIAEENKVSNSNTQATQVSSVPSADTSRPTGLDELNTRLTTLEGQVADLMKRMGNRNFDPEAANQRLDMAGQAVDSWDQQIADIDAQIAEASNPMSPNYSKDKVDTLMQMKQKYQNNRGVAAQDMRRAKKNAIDYNTQTGNYAVGVSKFPLDAMQSF